MSTKVSEVSLTTKLAWATWSLLANNPINKIVYIGFLAIYTMISLFYALCMIELVHSTNEQRALSYQGLIANASTTNSSNLTTSETTSQTNGLTLHFINSLDELIDTTLTQNVETLSLAVPLIPILTTISVALLIVTINRSKIIYWWLSCYSSSSITPIQASLQFNVQELNKPSIAKQILAAMLTAFKGFLYMPILEMIIKAFQVYNTRNQEEEVTGKDPDALAEYISITLGSSGLACLLLLMYYINKFYTLCIPHERVPWSTADTKLPSLEFITDTLLVVLHTQLDKGSRNMSILSVILLLALFTVQTLFRLLLTPTTQIQEVDIVLKFRDTTLCLIFFIGLICRALEDQLNLDLIYLILGLPLATMAWLGFQERKKNQVIKTITHSNGNERLSTDIENGIQYLSQLLQTVRNLEKKGDFKRLQNINGEILKLFLAHYESCSQSNCKCEEFQKYFSDDQQIESRIYIQNNNANNIQYRAASTNSIFKINYGLTSNWNSSDDQESKYSPSKKHSQIQSEYSPSSPSKDFPNLAKFQQQNNSGVSKRMQAEQNQLIGKYSNNYQANHYQYFSEIIALLVKDLAIKKPDSLQVALMHTYFTFTFLKQDVLSIYQLLNFNKNRLSKADQSFYIINELCLLAEIQNRQNQNAQPKLKIINQINPEKYLQHDNLQQQYAESIANLSRTVTWFWKGFSNQETDIDNILNVSSNIAKQLKCLFSTFTTLQEMNSEKDVSLYFRIAQVHLYLLNDYGQSEQYMMKVSRIIEMNKLHLKDGQSGNIQGGGNIIDNNQVLGTSQVMSDNPNFMLVDWNNQATLGQIIKVSKTCKRLLGWSDQDHEYNKYHIDNIMPDSVRMCHTKFISNFMTTGNSKVINQLNTWFLKHASGTIFPAEVFLKFHYSTSFGYTFFVIIKPLTVLQPFSNHSHYNIDQLLFFISPDNESTIDEFSASWSPFLRSFGLDMTQNENDSINKRTNELIIDMDFKNLQQTRRERMTQGKMYENTHTLDLSLFADNETQIKKRAFFRNGYQVRALTRIFEFSYGEGVLDLNIYCFSLLDCEETLPSMKYLKINEDDSLDGGKPDNSALQDLNDQQFSFNLQQQKRHTFMMNKSFKEDETQIIRHQESPSNSQSGQNSSVDSMESGNLTLNEFKNSSSLSQTQTPRTLSRIVKLILFLFVVLIVIASTNLGISMKIQSSSNLNVETIKLAIERLNLCAQLSVLLRVLVNIANGHEPPTSALSSNRFQDYQITQAATIEGFYNVQAALQRSKFQRSAQFLNFSTGQNSVLEYLGNKSNQTVQKAETLNTAMNILITNAKLVNTFTMEQLVGDTLIQQIGKSSTDQPSFYEQTVFIVLQNGLRRLRRIINDALNYYKADVSNSSNSDMLTSLLTMIISISTIIAISILITPMLTLSEARRYRSLGFFFKITQDKIHEMIVSIDKFQLQIDKNQQKEDNKEDKHVLKKESEMSLTEMVSLNILTNTPVKSLIQRSIIDSIIQEDDDEYQDAPEPVLSDHSNEKRKIAKSTEQKFNMQEEETVNIQNKVQEESLEVQKEKANFILLTNFTKKKQLNMIAYLLLVFTTLACYFLVQYFLSVKIFNKSAMVVEDLQIIFFKSACFDMVVGIERDDLIRNSTYNSIDPNQGLIQPGERFLTGNAYQLHYEFCKAKDDLYLELRQNLPVYFEEIQEFLLDIESKDACEKIFIDGLEYLSDKCKRALNGIMKQGISNTFSFMNSKILKQRIQFDSLAVSKKRDLASLRGMISDPTLIEILDFKLLVLDPVLSRLNYKAKQSVDNYINQLLTEFQAVYILFVMILSICLVVFLTFGFQKLKTRMIETNMILRIIPYETLQQQDKELLKEFFNQ